MVMSLLSAMHGALFDSVCHRLRVKPSKKHLLARMEDFGEFTSFRILVKYVIE